MRPPARRLILVFASMPAELAPVAASIIVIKELEAEKRDHSQAVTGVIAIIIASPAMPMPSPAPAEAFPAVPAVDFLNQTLIEYGQAVCR
jgi:hypothetical protein